MQQIGRYKILKRLGSGGFGEVWLGLDETIDREVAIKIFKPKDDNLIAFATSTDDEGLEVLRARFVSEARILSSLQDARYVVNVLEFGELEDGSPYYVMRYLPNSLTDLLGKDVFDAAAVAELPDSEKPRALPLEQALDYLEQIIEGVAEAHAEGLVHRDIKPSNIMLTDRGEIRLVDFGIAKAPDGGHSTVSQLGMGSRNYMAPEQRQSAKHVDATADVFAVGVVAYRITTGRLPEGRFADPNVAVPELHQRINDLILDCLHQEKADRPTDGSVLLERFRAARAAQGEVDESTGTWINTGESSVRDELKPLREQIESLLLQHGEVPVSEMRNLTALAHVADLDDDGLKLLINGVVEANEARIKPIRKINELIDAQLDANDLDSTSLYLAGKSIGWDEAKVDAAIAARTPNQPKQVEKPKEPPKAASLEPAHSSSEAKPASSYSTGKVIGLLMVLSVLAGGFWWGYGVYKEAQDYREEELEQTAIDQAEQSAWQEAERLDTIGGYEIYKANPIATPHRKAEATKRIEEIKVSSEGKQPSTVAIEELPKTEMTGLKDASVNEEAVLELPIAKTNSELEEESRPSVIDTEPIQIKRFEPGSSFKDCDFCPEMVVIPAGSFLMGTNDGYGYEKPVHRVTISAPFALGKYEVTFNEYDAFVRETRREFPEDRGWGRGQRPVIFVNKDDALAYTKWLSEKTNKRYRLPSESEWEYAARGGSQAKHHFGDDDQELCRFANHADKSAERSGHADQLNTCTDGVGRKTAVVGQYAPNQFGLYDTLGNVKEIVLDCWNEDYSGAPTDGSAWMTGRCNRQIRRGGNWLSTPWKVKSAYRSMAYNDRADTVGFRVAVELVPPSNKIASSDAIETSIPSTDKELQELLAFLDYEVTVDGKAGPGTWEKVNEFQSDNGLEEHNEVDERLRQQFAEVLSRKDDELWQRAKSYNRVSNLADYAKYLPFGKHHIEADDSAWARAQAIDSELAYDLYLSRLPDGRHAEAARESRFRLTGILWESVLKFDQRLPDNKYRIFEYNDGYFAHIRWESLLVNERDSKHAETLAPPPAARAGRLDSVLGAYDDGQLLAEFWRKTGQQEQKVVSKWEPKTQSIVWSISDKDALDILSIPSTDGGALVYSRADSGPSTSDGDRLEVTKLSAVGTVEWTKVHALNEKLDRRLPFFSAASIQRKNGGFILISAPESEGKIQLTLLDQEGEIAKSSTTTNLSGTSTSVKQLLELPDGGFVAIGKTHPYSWILRWDERGNVVWARRTGMDYQAITSDQTGRLYLGARKFNRDNDRFSCGLIMLASNGAQSNSTWSRDCGVIGLYYRQGGVFDMFLTPIEQGSRPAPRNHYGPVKARMKVAW